jgi:hypothetical protein
MKFWCPIINPVSDALITSFNAPHQRLMNGGTVNNLTKSQISLKFTLEQIGLFFKNPIKTIKKIFK